MENNTLSIKEHNMLIAEFMGYVNQSPTDKDFDFYENEGGTLLEASSMVYHSSWNWLIPVVEKIESLGYDTELVNRLDDGIGNIFYINDSIVQSELKAKKIDAVYDTVVKFILNHLDKS